ncbi:uncharacterized protein LOC118189423 [Stegodyphus dumicola]|uniref:uncharacterized protein LOC118189423 n=1 Tax=Stegodyphus dumicola TaxID=202533 RepID=UPI0015B11A1F|nr:uncharacterized protein LOC118189423 [Stegodyphus dumicola]
MHCIKSLIIHSKITRELNLDQKMNSSIIVCFVAVLMIGIADCQESCGNQECTADQCCLGVFMKRCVSRLKEGDFCGLGGGFLRCKECAAGLECKSYRCAPIGSETTSSVPSTEMPTMPSTEVETSPPTEETTVA